VPFSHAIPEADFAHRFQVSRDAPERFFGPTPERDHVLGERAHWLRENPKRYSAFLPGAKDLLGETIDLFRSWKIVTDSDHALEDGFARCIWLGQRSEPDFLILARETGASPRLLAGSVCFASGWALEEKIGMPLTSIHAVVPQLNESIGATIETFLNRLKPGVAWTRANWGLSGSPELNQHPSRKIPPIESPISLARVWLRIEDQALVALPKNNGILFGIRVSNISICELLVAEPAASSRLLRALETIPESMAAYKRIAHVRTEIADALRHAISNGGVHSSPSK
jgi:hypothetical protein